MDFETSRPKRITKVDLMGIISSQLTKFMERHCIKDQKTIADNTGISKATLSKAIKNGKGNTPLSIQSALLISESYGISLDYIYGTTQIENPQEYFAQEVKKHFSPSIFSADFNNQTYAIPTVSLSQCFLKYLETVWSIEKSKFSEVQKVEFLRQAQKELIKKMKESEECEKKKYAMIPLEILNCDRLLEDLGIHPENRI